MAEADTAAPTLVGLTLPDVDVTSGSKTVTFAMQASDVGTGLERASIVFERSFQDSSGARSVILFSSADFVDGEANVSQIINATTGSGTYTVQGILLYDKAGNQNFYSGGQLASLGIDNNFVVIDNDAGIPATAIIAVPTSIAEDGGQALALSVTLLNVGQASGMVTMSFAAAQSTATNGSDVSVPSYSGSYNISQSPVGNYVLTLPSISVLTDQDAEGTETIAVTIRASGQVFDTGTDTKTVLVKLIDSGQTGGAGADMLAGTRFIDDMSGGTGNDRLTGGLGDDRIDGGAGLDAAVFAGAFEQSGITIASGGVTVTGPDGRDILVGVERFEFVDGAFVFDPDSAGAQVQRVYDTVLGRAPDAVGLDYWVDRMEDTRLSLVGVADAIAGSAEFQVATGGFGNAAFVDYVYQNALGRAADGGGRDYWTGRLDAGLSRGEMLVGFSESAEHRALTANLVDRGYFQSDDAAQAVALIYDTALGRLPDSAGLAYWTEQVKTGARTIVQVAEAFTSSAEFQNATAGTSNTQFVDYMYRNTLDREPDGGGRAYWADQLDDGATRAALVLAFSQSSEHAGLFASHIIWGVDVL